MYNSSIKRSKCAATTVCMATGIVYVVCFYIHGLEKLFSTYVRTWYFSLTHAWLLVYYHILRMGPTWDKELHRDLNFPQILLSNLTSFGDFKSPYLALIFIFWESVGNLSFVRCVELKFPVFFWNFNFFIFSILARSSSKTVYNTRLYVTFFIFHCPSKYSGA